MLRKIVLVLVCVTAAASTYSACGGSDNGQGDGSTTCSAPNVQCGSTCSNPQTDPQNCGACGTVCTGGQVCSQGACALSCGGGTTMCNKLCVDTKIDPANCGGCSQPCSAGEACSGGKCGSQCGAGLTACGTDAGATACIDTSSDNSNCGGCGKVCGPNTTCVSSACQANLITTGPVDVTGSVGPCTTGAGAFGRKTAIDDGNNLYVGMICGSTAPKLYVATSQNGGLSYNAPVSTGLAGTEGAILVGYGPTPKLYGAATTAGGALLISVSADNGKTWSPGQTLDTPVNNGGNYGVSMAMYQADSTLYVGVNPMLNGATLHVLRNGTGIGDAGLADVDDAGFALTSVSLTSVNLSDIMVDQSNGNVWAFGEANGVYDILESTNGGQSFGAPSTPPGGASFADAVLAKSTIFVSGSPDTLDVITTRAPATQTTVPGLGAINLQPDLRSLGVDTSGNVYVATATNTDIEVARILFSAAIADAGPPDGGSSIDSVRLVPSVATGPTITARQPNAAVMAYTVNGHVYATTLAY